MESDINQLPTNSPINCDCCCNRCESTITINGSCSRTWIRSVKRKIDELEVERERFRIPGLVIPDVARVEIENECGALREMVTSQQKTIRDLSGELEEERNAASSAANEAMSMILRLQREKAEIEMEARQFKRFSEEKTSHDQQEIAILEDLLYKREQTIQSLTCEVQAYKYRMMSYGFTESEAEGEKVVITGTNSVATNSEHQFDFIPFDYPPLKCNSNEHQIYPESETETIDIDKYAFGETPHSLKEIEERINQLEKSPKHPPVFEKVIVGHSPRKPKLSTRFSMDSSTGSFFATIKEDAVSVTDSRNFKKVDNASVYSDEMSDKIYTVDSIHYRQQSYHNDPKANNTKVFDDFMSTPKDSPTHTEMQDPEVMKLYARLHALEADRESMRQAIINMRTDKAQLVLLKEIAQNLCKDMSPPSRMPKKQSLVGNLFAFSVFKWVTSLVMWRRRASRSKYMFGMTGSNAGLIMVLDKGSQMEQWRCLMRTQL